MLAARMGSAEAVNVLLNSATSDVPVEHGAICKAAREMHKWKTAVEAIKAAAAAAGSPVSNRAEFSKLMRDAAQAEQDEEKKTTKAAGTIGAQIVDDIDVTGLGKDDDHYAEEADAKVKSGKGKRAMLLLLSTVNADGYDEVKAVLTEMLSRRPWNYVSLLTDKQCSRLSSLDMLAFEQLNLMALIAAAAARIAARRHRSDARRGCNLRLDG
eukprot:COSAG02_NODE_2482_length_8724_cov_136.350609_6_plen_212_part_00